MIGLMSFSEERLELTVSQGRIPQHSSYLLTRKRFHKSSTMRTPWSQTSRAVGNKFLLSSHPACGTFVIAAQADEDNEDLRLWHLRAFLVLTFDSAFPRVHNVLGYDEQWSLWEGRGVHLWEEAGCLCFGHFQPLNPMLDSPSFPNFHSGSLGPLNLGTQMVATFYLLTKLQPRWHSFIGHASHPGSCMLFPLTRMCIIT